MNKTLAKIEQTLKLKRLKKTDMLQELNISNSTYYTWKKRDSLPSPELLLPIAKYLGVTTDYLLSEDDEPPVEDSYYIDPKTKEIADSLNSNVGQRVLFDATKDMPPEDILKVIDFIQQQNKKEGRE